MTQPYESLREELLRLESLALALEPFSDAQLYCFIEGSSRELFDTFDADLIAAQLRVIGELERRAEASPTREASAAKNARCFDFTQRLEACREASTWQLRQLQAVVRLRAFYKP